MNDWPKDFDSQRADALAKRLGLKLEPQRGNWYVLAPNGKVLFAGKHPRCKSFLYGLWVGKRWQAERTAYLAG